MDVSEKGGAIKPSSTLMLTAEAKRMAAEGKNVVGLSAGEPDFDTPSHIKAAAIDAINSGFTKYTPEAGIVELRRAIADKLERDNDLHYDYTQIVVSNGGKQALFNALFAIVNPGDEVLIPSPYWLTYPEIVRLVGGVPVFMQTSAHNAFRVTEEILAANVSPNTKAIIVNSPNNPTGAVYDAEDIEVIARFAHDNDIYIISDEIYEKLIYDDAKHISIAALNDDIFNRTIVINGLSKSCAMTGWRMGFSAAPKKIAQIMSNLQAHTTSGINSITQKAALAAYNGSQERVEYMRQQFALRRDYIMGRLDDIPQISTVCPRGAFYVFVDISGLLGKSSCGNAITNSTNFCRLLLEQENTVIIPCEDFGSSNHVRLSYATSMDVIDEAMTRLQRFILNIE